MALSLTQVKVPLIVTQLRGGLGNQLFQYAAGKAVAERVGGQLFVDVGHVLRQGESRPLGLFHFAVDAQILCTDELAGETPETIAQWMGLPQPQLVQEIQGDAPDPCLKALSGDAYLIGYWQHYQYFESVADQIRKEYVLRNGLRSRLRLAQERIRSLGTTVAVHVRRSDYLGVHGALPASYYHEAISGLADFRGQAVPVFFSDDPQWVRQQLLPLYGGEVISDKWHLRDYEELVLMASCTHHIIANSSFSWWAAWLGKTDVQRVIRPHPWFAFENHFCSKTGICPDDWGRVDLKEPFEIDVKSPKARDFPRRAALALLRRFRSRLRRRLHRQRALRARQRMGHNRPLFRVASLPTGDQPPQANSSCGTKNQYWVETMDYRQRISADLDTAALRLCQSDIALSESQMRQLGLSVADHDTAVLRVYPVV